MKYAVLAVLIICIVLIGGLYLGSAAVESQAMQSITTSLQGAAK